MSSNVDNRVVRMTFDNAQFEKNIKNTMKTLSEFEQKLKFSTASKGFEAIKSAADKLNFSALGKNADAADKKIANLASNAKSSLDKMQQQLDKADFSGMGSSADKAANQINKALSSIDFNSLDKNAQIALSSITNEAGKVDLSAITDAAGRVDFSALPDNVAIAIATVMDMAGDVNFDGMAKQASDAMADINSAADKVDFSSIGLGANDAVSQINSAAGQADFSPVSNSAWTASNDTNKAISSIDLNSLVDATDEASRGFQTMETIAIGALLNIGNQITDLVTGKLMQLGKSLTSPITEGLGEYQTQIGAIQTILANTGRSFDSSSDIAEVNAVLDELNTYADKTIYNFTEMVKNIGMFTAAGTDMYQSADAIKGMSNLAALQGADPTSAARAMYQTSQALSSGVVRLMDWRSLENAGMAGEIFRNVVLDAAEKKFESQGDEGSLSLIKKIQNGTATFTDTLTKNEWLTSDILLESLTQLTYAFGDLEDESANLTEAEREDLEMRKKDAEEHLKSLGYTEEEIKAVFELGDKAQKSATEVRTFSQLIDSLGEAMGSGWTETWRYILGDFKEITDVMTKLNDALTTVIGTWDNARNSILGEWSNLGGHYELFGGTRQIYKRDAEGNVIEDVNGNPILLDEKKYVGAFDYILEAIGKPLTALKEAAEVVFGDYLTGDHLMDITEAFTDFTESLVLSEDATEGLKGIFEAVFEVIKAVSQIATHVVDTALNLVSVVRTVTDPIFDIVLSIFGKTGEGFAGVIDWLLDIEDQVYKFINSGLLDLADILDAIVGGFFDLIDIPGTISIVGEAIGSFFTAFTKSVDIGDILDKAGNTIGEFFIGVLDSFGLVPEIEEATSLPVIFEKIKDSARENLSKAMDKIVDAIPGMRDFVTVMSGDDKAAKVQYFIDLFKKIGDIVLPVVKTLAVPLVALKDALVGLFNIAINSQPVQDLIKWVTELKDKAIDWLLSLPTKIATTATNLGQAFDVLLGNTKITEVSSDVRKMVYEIGDINITTPFVLLGGGIREALKTVITTVRGAVTELSETLFGWIDDDPKEFTKKVKEFIAGLPSIFSNAERGMKDFAKILLPNSMNEDIDNWFRDTHIALTTGLGRLSAWISTTTEGSKTVPDALIAIITGGWTAMINAIKNFDPQEAAINLLTKLDEIKNTVLTSTGGFLDYIFGFKKERVLGTSGYEEVGFTFTEYFKDISSNVSKGIEEAKKTINSLFSDEDESIFDKITKFFTGDDKSEITLQIKMDNLSKNLNDSAKSMTGDFTKTVTDPSLSFDKISGFIDVHKNDIFIPLQGITTWFDTTLFPNTNRIFTTGLTTIQTTITGWFNDIHTFLEPFFTNVESWPEFFSTSLDNVAKAIGSGLGDIINFFSSDDFSFAKMFDTIGDKVKEFVETVREKFPLIGDILGGVLLVVEPIFATLAGILSGIGDGALSTGDTLAKAFSDIPGTISSIWEGITSTFGGAWDSFLTSLDEKVPGAKAVIEQVLTDLNDMFNIFDGKIGESSDGILGHISEFFNGLIPIAQNEESKGAVDIIKDVLTNLWDSLNEDKLLVISTAIEKVGVGILLVNLGKFIGGLKEVIDKIFLGKEKQTLGDKVKDIAEAIAIVTGSIWVISQIEEKDLERAKSTMDKILETFVKLEAIGLGVSAVARVFKIEEFSSVKGEAMELFAMTLAIAVIGMIPDDQIEKATNTILLLKGAMSAIDLVTNAAIAFATNLAGLDVFAPMSNSVTQILAFALAVVVFSFIKEEDIYKAIAALFVLGMAMAALQIVFGIVTGIMPPSEQTLTNMSNAAVKLAAAVALMCFGFSLISDADTANLAIAAGAVAIILTIFGLVAAFTQAEDAKKTATAMVIAAASVVELCFAFTLVDGMDNETLEAVGTAVAKIVAIFGLVIAFTQANDAIKTAQALVIASFSVIEMCAGFWMVKDVNNETIETVTIAVDSILIIMGLIVAFTKAQDVLATAGALAIASLSVLEMCAGFWLAKDVDNETIEAVGTAVSKIMAIFGLIVAFTKEIDAVATGVSLALAGAAVIEMCEGFKSLNGMNVEDIQSISDSISKIMGVMGIISAALSLPIFQGGGLAMIEIAGAFWIFAEALKAFTEAIRAILELEADLPGLVDNANKGLEELKGKIKEHFDNLIDIAVEWWDTVVMPKVNEFLQSLSDWWENTAKPAISKFFTELPENFKNWWDNTAFPAIQGALDALEKWWNETALPAIGKFLDEAPAKLSKWWNETAWPTICKLWDSLGKWWNETAWPGIKKFFTTDLPKKIADWWENTAKPALKNVKDKAWKAITDNWEKLKKKVATAISNWWKGIKEGFNEKVEGAKKFISEIPDKLFKALGDLEKKGADIVTGIINGMVDAVQSNPIVQAVNSVGESISGGLNKYFGINSPSKLMRDTVGKSITEGIGVGMVKYSNLLRKSVLKMGGDTLKTITKYFGIHSPSRLMRDKVGKYIPAGIAAGMDEYAVIAVDSAEALGSSVTQAVYSGLGDISASKYGYGISPVIDMETLKTDIEVIHEMLRIKIDEAMQGLKDYLTEQISLNYQIDEDRYANLTAEAQAEIEKIHEYVETEKTNLYGYFDQLTSALTDQIPNMTQQILNAFDTTNQSVAGILQAVSSEQRQAVDSAITGTIVESLASLNSSITNEIKESLVAIASALNGDVSEDQLSEDYKTWYHTGNDDDGTYEEHARTKKNSLVGILLDFYTRFDEWKSHDAEQSHSDVTAILGMMNGKGAEGAPYYSESIQDSLTQGGLYNGELGLAETVTNLLSAIVGGDGTGAEGSTLFSKLDKSSENQEDLSKYLQGALGSDVDTSALDKLGFIQENQKSYKDIVQDILDKNTSIDDLLPKYLQGQDDIAELIGILNDNVVTLADLKVVLDSGELVGQLSQGVNDTLGNSVNFLERTGNNIVNFKRNLGF